METNGERCSFRTLASRHPTWYLKFALSRLLLVSMHGLEEPEPGFLDGLRILLLLLARLRVLLLQAINEGLEVGLQLLQIALLLLDHCLPLRSTEGLELFDLRLLIPH